MTASGKPAKEPFLVSKALRWITNRGTILVDFVSSLRLQAPILLQLTANCTGDGTRDVAVELDLGPEEAMLESNCRDCIQILDESEGSVGSKLLVAAARSRAQRFVEALRCAAYRVPQDV